MHPLEPSFRGLLWVVRDRSSARGVGGLCSRQRALKGLRLSAACLTGPHRRFERPSMFGMVTPAKGRSQVADGRCRAMWPRRDIHTMAYVHLVGSASAERRLPGDPRPAGRTTPRKGSLSRRSKWSCGGFWAVRSSLSERVPEADHHRVGVNRQIERTGRQAAAPQARDNRWRGRSRPDDAAWQHL